MSAPLGLDWLTTRTGRMTTAWWNVVVCAVLIVGSLVMGFTQHPFGLIVACLGFVMEFQFVRLLLRLRRELRGAHATGIERPDEGRRS